MTETDYRDTVFLPRTDFPMRGDLPKKEPTILARWEPMANITTSMPTRWRLRAPRQPMPTRLFF